MLQQRSGICSHPYTWSFWGGKAEQDERPVETLLRECREEIGSLPDIEKVYPIHTFVSDDGKFTYHTFCITVYEEFVPQVNVESAGYSWVPIDCWPQPLHRGAKLIFDKKEMLEKIQTIYNRKRDETDLCNWLDTF